MYVNMTPKGKTEGVLAFVVPTAQCHMVLNGVHWECQPPGPATDPGSHVGEVPVAHDG